MKILFVFAVVCCLVANTVAFEDDFMLKYPPSMFSNGNPAPSFGMAAGVNPLTALNPYQTYSEGDVQFEQPMAMAPPFLQQQAPQQQAAQLPTNLPGVRFMSERVNAPGEFATTTITSNGVTQTRTAPADASTHELDASTQESDASTHESDASASGHGHGHRHHGHHGHHGRRHIITTTTTAVTKKLHAAGEPEEMTEAAAAKRADEKEAEVEKLELAVEREKAKAEVVETRLAELKELEDQKERQIERARERHHHHRHNQPGHHHSGSDSSEHHGHHGHRSHHDGSSSSDSSHDSSHDSSESSHESSYGSSHESSHGSSHESSHGSSHESSHGSSHESSSSPQRKKCGNKKLRISITEEDGCEEDSVVNTELLHVKEKLDALTKVLKNKVGTYDNEHQWFAKALDLIKSLRTKAVNVKLHLHDLNNEIHHVAAERNHVEDEFVKLKHDLEDEKRMKDLQNAMEKLLGEADSVRGQISQLSHKKSHYLTKVQELQESLAALKAKKEAEKNHDSQVIVVAQQACPCHLPSHLRSCACL